MKVKNSSSKSGKAVVGEITRAILQTLMLNGNTDASLVGVMQMNFEKTSATGVVQLGDQLVEAKLTIGVGERGGAKLTIDGITSHLNGSRSKRGGQWNVNGQKGDIYADLKWSDRTVRITFVEYSDASAEGGFDAQALLAKINASYDQRKQRRDASGTM